MCHGAAAPCIWSQRCQIRELGHAEILDSSSVDQPRDLVDRLGDRLARLAAQLAPRIWPGTAGMPERPTPQGRRERPPRAPGRSGSSAFVTAVSLRALCGPPRLDSSHDFTGCAGKRARRVATSGNSMPSRPADRPPSTCGRSAPACDVASSCARSSEPINRVDEALTQTGPTSAGRANAARHGKRSHLWPVRSASRLPDPLPARGWSPGADGSGESSAGAPRVGHSHVLFSQRLQQGDGDLRIQGPEGFRLWVRRRAGCAPAI